jgi:hypothetical protein
MRRRARVHRQRVARAGRLGGGPAGPPASWGQVLSGRLSLAPCLPHRVAHARRHDGRACDHMCVPAELPPRCSARQLDPASARGARGRPSRNHVDFSPTFSMRRMASTALFASSLDLDCSASAKSSLFRQKLPARIGVRRRQRFERGEGRVDDGGILAVHQCGRDGSVRSAFGLFGVGDPGKIVGSNDDGPERVAGVASPERAARPAGDSWLRGDDGQHRRAGVGQREGGHGDGPEARFLSVD